MQVKPDSWIHNLAPILKQNSIPVDIADAQLSAQFKKSTNLRLVDFNLLPAAPHPFCIKSKDSVYWIEGDLLGRSMATPVTIAWNKVGANYTFWWHELAVEDILAAEKTNEQEKQDLANLLGEKVIVNNCIFPHFTILFQTKIAISPAKLEQLKQQIIDHTESWNTNDKAQGIVHNIYEIKQRATNIVALKIDVGSADIAYLKTLFERLNEISRLQKITIN